MPTLSKIHKNTAALAKQAAMIAGFAFSSYSNSAPSTPAIEIPSGSSSSVQQAETVTEKPTAPSPTQAPTEQQKDTLLQHQANENLENKISPEIHQELIAIHDQLQKLKPWYTAVFPGIFALLGIVIGGVISLFIQRSQRQHDTTERLKKSGFEAKLKLIEYRSKQVNEFYGPMLVLLKQSKELSMQLHTQLSADAPDRYKFENDSTSKMGKSLFIHQPDQPEKAFRLISELPYLGKNHKTALPRVKVIIDTGERLAKIIEEKSGLVKPSSQALIGCLGIYLAHLTALRDAYSLTQKPKGIALRTHDAVFPREIEGLTRSDYDDFITQITEWEELVDKLLKDQK